MSLLNTSNASSQRNEQLTSQNRYEFPTGSQDHHQEDNPSTVSLEVIVVDLELISPTRYS